MALSALAAVGFAGCDGGGGSGGQLEKGPTVAGFEFAAPTEVHDGSTVPRRMTCDGSDDEPGVWWRGTPDGTRELALVVEDPDAPSGTFTHWLVYAINPEATSFVDVKRMLPGLNDFGHEGYDGPCPPRGETHHYVFRLLALDNALDLEEGADRAAFDDAVRPHVLAEARLTATYERP